MGGGGVTTTGREGGGGTTNDAEDGITLVVDISSGAGVCLERDEGAATPRNSEKGRRMGERGVRL